MGRWQLMQAILLFAGAPLYLLFLLAAAVAAATDHDLALSRFGRRWLWPSPGPARSMRRSCWAMPRLRCRPKNAPAMAGWPVSPSASVAEFAFTLLLDAISTVAKTGAMLRLSRCRLDPAEPRRPRRRVGRGDPTALATDRSWRGGVLRFRRRRVGDRPLGGAVGRRSAAGDPAMRFDRPTAHRSMAANLADRGNTRGNQPSRRTPDGDAGACIGVATAARARLIRPHHARSYSRRLRDLDALSRRVARVYREVVQLERKPLIAV